MSEPIASRPPPSRPRSASAPCAAPGFHASRASTRSVAGRWPGLSSSAAVVLDLEARARGTCRFEGPHGEQREALFGEILATAHVGIASISHADVDSINIRQASLRPCAAPSPPCPARPTWRWSTATIRRPALQGRGDHQGRRVDRVDRRRLHRRQGGARPADGAARARSTRSTASHQCRLRDRDASLGAGERRTLPVSPHDFFAAAPRVTGSVT